MKTILLIDDDKNIRMAYSLVLRHNGYKVLEAASGEAGLDMARQHLPDLIISDIFMPGTDGQEVLQQIRKNPDLSHKQVVLLTGHPDAVTPRRGMNLGADDFLVKPVELEDLLKCVEARLSRANVHWRVEDRMLSELRTTMHSTLPLEFSTPLAGIIGLTGILRSDLRKLSPDEVEDVLDDISNTAFRLQRTQRNYLMILDLLDAEPKTLEPEDRLSQQAVEESILAGIKASSRRTRRRADITVTVEEAPVFVDAEELSIMVEELVDNACNYSPAGTPVTVHFEKDGSLTVTDAGRGLSAEEIKQIGVFQQFDRKKHAQRGLGLGLVLVQKLAAKWGAPFSVQSTPFHETKVRIAFQAKLTPGKE